MAIVLAVALLALVVLSSRIVYIASFAPGISQLPGPVLARLTDLKSVIDARNHNFCSNLQDLHRKLGGVVRIGPNRVSISDPRYTDIIYGARTEFEKSAHLTPLHGLIDGRLSESMAGIQDRRKHAAVRKPISGVMSMSNIARFEALMDDMITLLVRRLAGMAASPSHLVALDEWVNYFALDVMSLITTGDALGFLEKGEDVDDMMKTINGPIQLIALTIHMPWVHTLFRSIEMMTTKSTAPFLAYGRSVLEGRRSSPSKDRDDLLTGFLSAQQANPVAVTDDQMYQYIGTNLIAAFDPASALIFIIFHVLNAKARGNPEILRRIQAELDSTLASETVQQPIPYRYAREKLPYLGAVVQEALRLEPNFGAPSDRVVPASGLDLLDGTRLPAGTVVGMSAVTVHRDRDTFGHDADEFNPDRWLQADGESEEAFSRRMSKMKAADFTWGRGSRTCLGKNIALLEVYKVSATLFSLFDMELVDTESWAVLELAVRIPMGLKVELKWRAGKGLESLSKQ